VNRGFAAHCCILIFLQHWLGCAFALARGGKAGHKGRMGICILHTGGTIAMRQGPRGLEPAEGLLEAGLAQLVHQGAAPDGCAVMPLAPLIDSANARFDDWNRMALQVVALHGRYRGFVITHGTDTLAYTAAALAFSLLGLARPVVVTGAMLPFDAPHSDAPRNLADAVQAAGQAAPGVWVQFGGQLMPGAKVHKAHSQAMAAFVTPNPGRGGASARGPLAGDGAAAQPLHLPYGQPEIAVLSMAPNGSARALAAALDCCDGAVLRVFGAGTLPDDPQLHAALMRAQARGVLMIATSQCEAGGVALGTYAAGDVLARAGVVDGGAITPEAAYAKLAHALAHGGRACLIRDLCGEG
jgi:L-asparaginase